MALGGYKFAGRYCNKGSLSDTEWCLLMHKTRVKAFLDANAISNAGWEVDYTDGEIAFETYGNCIYRLDDLGYNFVTTFKNGDSAFFHICTYCKWQTGSASLAQGIIQIAPVRSYPSSAGILAESRGSSLFCRIGTQRKAPNSTNILGMTELVPTGSYGSYADNSISPASTYTAASVSSFYYGFAIKGKHIITIYTSGGVPGVNSPVTVFSADAFQTVYNTDETVRYGNILFSYSTGIQTYGERAGCVGEQNVQSTNFAYVDGSYNYLGATWMFAPYATGVAQPTELYPFESVSLSNTEKPSGSSYKCAGRGVFPIDLIARMTTSGAAFSRLSTAGNGNYLTVYKSSGTNYVYPIGQSAQNRFSVNENLFVGWDPSNPDVTQASAWTEYTSEAPTAQTAPVDPVILQ